MDIEAEIDKIIYATSNLSDHESYQYEIPQEWKKYLSCIHVQRPDGIVIWDMNGTVILGRVVLSPDKMRKALRKIMKRVDAHDTTMEHPEEAKKRKWAKLWDMRY
jgi:hypothetical protein